MSTHAQRARRRRKRQGRRSRLRSAKIDSRPPRLAAPPPPPLPPPPPRDAAAVRTRASLLGARTKARRRAWREADCCPVPVPCGNLACHTLHLWPCPVGQVGVGAALRSAACRGIDGRLIAVDPIEVAMPRLLKRTCATHRAEIAAAPSLEPQ